MPVGVLVQALARFAPALSGLQQQRLDAASNVGGELGSIQQAIEIVPPGHMQAPIFPEGMPVTAVLRRQDCGALAENRTVDGEAVVLSLGQPLVFAHSLKLPD